MGRKKEPVNVLLAKGKKHLTKEEIEKRKNEELPVYDDKIVAPKTLPKKYHKDFNFYVEELRRLNILSNLDVELLSNYIIIKNLYDAVVRALIDNPFNDGLVKVQDKYFKQLITLSRELGLTVSSRLKLIVPKKEEDKKENPTAFDVVFGDKL